MVYTWCAGKGPAKPPQAAAAKPIPAHSPLAAFSEDGTDGGDAEDYSDSDFEGHEGYRKGVPPPISLHYSHSTCAVPGLQSVAFDVSVRAVTEIGGKLAQRWHTDRLTAACQHPSASIC